MKFFDRCNENNHLVHFLKLFETILRGKVANVKDSEQLLHLVYLGLGSDTALGAIVLLVKRYRQVDLSCVSLLYTLIKIRLEFIRT